MGSKKMVLVVSVMSLSLFACRGGATPPPAPAAPAGLPPALSDVDFPAQVVDYPPDWPADLRYPEQFQPADFSMGTLPDGNQMSWVVKLRGPGTAADSANDLSTFLTQNGWTIDDAQILGGGGILLMVQSEGGGSGLFVIDSDPQQAGQSLILAMINR